jgi:arsenate reductase
MSLKLYWLPNCSTCQKADAYLKNNEQQVVEYRDVKAQPLSESEIKSLAKLVGVVDSLFSRRARKYRELGLHERELSEDELLDLMASEYTFIKRPVLVEDGRAIAGFTSRSYDQFIGER